MNFQVVFFCFLVWYCVCAPRDNGANEPEFSSRKEYEDLPTNGHEDFSDKKDKPTKSFEDLTLEEKKEKLGLLFDKIDKDKNKYVTSQELEDWFYLQSENTKNDVEKELQWRDSDKSGTIDWKEYKNATYGFIFHQGNKNTSEEEDEEEEEKENEKEEKSKNEQEEETCKNRTGRNYLKKFVASDKRRFNKADLDGNKELTAEEYEAFLFPESKDRMKEHVVDEALTSMDKDKDHLITVAEYVDFAAGDFLPNPESKQDREWIVAEKAVFKEHDKNSDGKIDRNEIRKWVLPPDFGDYASEAKHLMKKSDQNNDGKLSRKEMIEKYKLFVNSRVADFGETLKKVDDL